MGLDQTIIIAEKNLEKFEFTKKYEKHIIKEIWLRKVNCLQGYIESKYDIRNCVLTKISIKDIEYLYKVSKEILETKNIEYAKENLPTYEGFFFGSYEYDKYYFDDIKEIFSITKEIKESFKDYDYYYWCWY